MSLCTYTLIFLSRAHTHKQTAHLHSIDCPVSAEDSREMTSLLEDRLAEGREQEAGEEKKRGQICRKISPLVDFINLVKLRESILSPSPSFSLPLSHFLSHAVVQSEWCVL